MARSKSGGTRSYIRGKIGADVYCVGKTGKGDRQQVVRSLAEQVANPQTSPQMVQRMLMSSVAQLTRALKPIIDHSFDGVPAGQPSISHFRQLALNAYKVDSEKAEPDFGYVGWQGKQIPNADVQISSGKAVFPIIWLPAGANEYTSAYGKGGFTAFLPGLANPGGEAAKECHNKDIIDYLCGGDVANYLTYVSIKAMKDPVTHEFGEPIVGYVRMTFDPTAKPDDYDWSGDLLRVGKGLILEGNMNMDIMVTAGEYGNPLGGSFYMETIEGGVFPEMSGLETLAEGLIFSKKDDKKGYIHSSSMLQKSGYYNEEFNSQDTPTGTFDYPANPLTMAAALATYPVGSARFLNGGDI